MALIGSVSDLVEVLSARVSASIAGSMNEENFQAAYNTLRTVAVRRRKRNLRSASPTDRAACGHAPPRQARARGYPKATAAMKKDGELWRLSRLRPVKYPNNIVAQDHRKVKWLARPGLGFSSIWTARRALAGYEAMAMPSKGQVRNISGSDIRAQATFIAGPFQFAA
jgi:transposase-like protein